MLLKQADTFRTRLGDFASLLPEHSGIGREDLDAFENLHPWRAAIGARLRCTRGYDAYVHRIKRAAEQQKLQLQSRRACGEIYTLSRRFHGQWPNPGN